MTPTLPITERELTVLAEVASHGNQSDAARHLGISIETVKRHLSEIYRRLGVDNILGALAAVGWLYTLPDHRP